MLQKPEGCRSGLAKGKKDGEKAESILEYTAGINQNQTWI
jgi:hypothetical protein